MTAHWQQFTAEIGPIIYVTIPKLQQGIRSLCRTRLSLDNVIVYGGLAIMQFNRSIHKCTVTSSGKVYRRNNSGI